MLQLLAVHGAGDLLHVFRLHGVVLRHGVAAPVLLQIGLESLQHLAGAGLEALGHLIGDDALLGGLGGDVFPELIVQGAAVAGGGGLDEARAVGLREHVIHGGALEQLLAAGVQLGGVHLGAQAFHIPPDGVHRLPGGHELPVYTCPFRKSFIRKALGVDLFLEHLGALRGGGHILGGDVLGDAVHIQDVLLELILQLAAVAGGDGALGLVGVVADKFLEGLAVRQLRGLLAGGLGIQVEFQAVLLAPDRVDGAAGAQDLRQELGLLLRGLAVIFGLDPLLQALDALQGGGGVLGGQVLGQDVQLPDVLLELVRQLAAVAGAGGADRLLPVIRHVILEGLAVQQDRRHHTSLYQTR